MTSCQTYLGLASRPGVSRRTDALELADAVEASAAVQARTRLALVVFEVALRPAEALSINIESVQYVRERKKEREGEKRATHTRRMGPLGQEAADGC